MLAPAEHAFRRLSAAERRALFDPDNRSRLDALVRRHIVPRRRTKRALRAEPTLATLGHEGIPIAVDNGVMRIGGARVLFQDQSPRNGVVLTIDRLLPEPEIRAAK